MIDYYDWFAKREATREALAKARKTRFTPKKPKSLNPSRLLRMGNHTVK